MYRQCNDQMKRCTDNVMTKWKDVQTMQWPNEKMYRQCNDQMKRCTDNVMTKWKDVQTMGKTEQALWKQTKSKKNKLYQNTMEADLIGSTGWHQHSVQLHLCPHTNC